ncbi:10 kDa heat shock protein, mitochondrial-like [Eptesicus fuscus]|uniref:10 kDa heat shock protein, mitochondrial-like n=1 Tax=Eptesicus fuscus TaxID=29078 RepID=UPI0024044066|nr:10 kDa heat shock protein, mitochondrial-like [Eptesicus fuscus]
MAWRTRLCTGWPFPKFTCPEASLSLQPQESPVPAATAGVTAGQAFRKSLPLVGRVLLERSAAETVTKGGILLPEKSPGEVLQATVITVEWGSKGKGGATQPVKVQMGDKLLPEYGAIKVVLDNKDCFLFRNGDILGKCRLK